MAKAVEELLLLVDVVGTEGWEALLADPPSVGSLPLLLLPLPTLLPAASGRVVGGSDTCRGAGLEKRALAALAAPSCIGHPKNQKRLHIGIPVHARVRARLCAQMRGCADVHVEEAGCCVRARFARLAAGGQAAAPGHCQHIR